ncbi:adenine phosphoribosyltransferase [Candidatus Woesearchaeota archaeon]|nr:adenine phosphoribosyltransferase [Candidatus Woesearchaeota archaeon]
MDIKSMIRTIPNFPKQGIMFRDVTTLLKNPIGFNYVIDQFVKRYEDMDIDYVVGIESRGFILAGAIAYRLNKGFIPVRKPGKLPYDVDSIEYELEYGTDKLEIHLDALKEGDKVILIDDLLATGGTSRAAAQLIEKRGAKVIEFGCIVELPDLKGREKLNGYPVYNMIEFEGD